MSAQVTLFYPLSENLKRVTFPVGMAYTICAPASDLIDHVRRTLYGSQTIPH